MGLDVRAGFGFGFHGLDFRAARAAFKAVGEEDMDWGIGHDEYGSCFEHCLLGMMGSRTLYVHFAG
jgi:hypothetical protein